MPASLPDLHRFLSSVHPYDAMPVEELARLVEAFELRKFSGGQQVYGFGETLEGLYLIHSGQIEIRDENDVPVSLLGMRNSFAERGLQRDGIAATTARALDDVVLLLLPKAAFETLIKTNDAARRFFDRSRAPRRKTNDLATSRVDELMTRNPVICVPDTTVQQAAKIMRDKRISALCVTEGEHLVGIVSVRDLAARVLAAALALDTPVGAIMTATPLTLPPSAIGSDVLHAMMERKINHIPICESGRLIGMVSQTDLTRFQAVSSAELVSEIAHADTAEDMATVTARIPQLLVQLVGAGNRHEVVTRLITDVADTATRRLLTLAEEKLGPPPVPYLWLACGSQGRQEQTGASDQDNCLFLDDAVTDEQMPYFVALAQFVCDGLNTCGYVYCPGDMMATNPKWCQPVRIWREYFHRWIEQPDPMAQMLASVMFDLRPIGGALTLFADLQRETLSKASANSIFVAHMVGNSLKHTPPLGLLRGFATIRSGEHKNMLDMKHNGVVPVVDLGRIYALMGQVEPVNTRARLERAAGAGGLSPSGARDLLDAYDLIAENRLAHQARQVRRGAAPDNYMEPTELSDLERSHLRNAFVVIKSLQSALGHNRSVGG
ncbi:Glycine betaine/carnitine/choline transport ATP-binding protein OpuCA [Thalassovita gelatinovora]|uniref:Glycine betaine/carnitine/choline transport ATP-binding protein OpuCA n=1 Tax=Thalassovita gelatinovora TaxID=53501 RepID=A0A0P1F3V2_THAGE|nr:DUF294 nucleotidyltransferase-like domain-containing protein [Thalassovita gelatinovora]QIZ79251.1 CBS domain-containing protein [Thalassovita gelatinovora]CUH62438.1 Glycine betaine/carnitine/choline transport ATP-binding protein OpuCA [Thalassovita gelatinovora]SEQ04319.1 CBS domain-containing protein [Thalassovita gelatinovora]